MLWECMLIIQTILPVPCTCLHSFYMTVCGLNTSYQHNATVVSSDSLFYEDRVSLCRMVLTTKPLYHIVVKTQVWIQLSICIVQRILGSHEDLFWRVPRYMKRLISRTNADSLLTCSLVCGYVKFTYDLVILVPHILDVTSLPCL